MIFDNVKVGDKFLYKATDEVIEVTELSEKGFKYSVENPHRHMWPARYGPSLHMGGEMFTKHNGYGDFLHKWWDENYERILI